MLKFFYIGRARIRRVLLLLFMVVVFFPFVFSHVRDFFFIFANFSVGFFMPSSCNIPIRVF